MPSDSEFNRYCCHRCWKRYIVANPSVWPFQDQMIVCKTCGNKRCPKATDHHLPCTGSNEPGQPGSRYKNPTARNAGGEE